MPLYLLIELITVDDHLGRNQLQLEWDEHGRLDVVIVCSGTYDRDTVTLKMLSKSEKNHLKKMIKL